jgi:hypothetical protein
MHNKENVVQNTIKDTWHIPLFLCLAIICLTNLGYFQFCVRKKVVCEYLKGPFLTSTAKKTEKYIVMLWNDSCKILRNLPASLVRVLEYPNGMDNVPYIARNPGNL